MSHEQVIQVEDKALRHPTHHQTQTSMYLPIPAKSEQITLFQQGHHQN
jgi:hypothetical protein